MEHQWRNIGVFWAAIVIVSSLVFSPFATAQSTESLPKRRTIFERILLNGDTIPKERWYSLYLNRQDTLELEFRCIVQFAPRVPILFIKTLQKGTEKDQTYSETNNRTTIRFTGLQENYYTFEATAFAPQEQWQALPIAISFVVNDSLAGVQRRTWAIESAWQQKNLVRQDSLLGVFQEELQSRISSYRSPFVYLTIFFAFTTAVSVAIYILHKKKNNHLYTGNTGFSQDTALFAATIDKEFTMAKSLGTDANTTELLQENQALRDEITALRGQIDGLQARTLELRRINAELRKQHEDVMQHKQHLEELQKQKDELIAMVVHDIKNPASLIRSMVELLKSYDLSAEEQHELMDGLLDTSNRIFVLAQDVSRVIALESTNLNLDKQEYSVNDLLTGVCDRNRVAAQRKGIIISNSTLGDLPYIPIDALRIEEALENLVSNAIKFSSTGTSIEVKAYQKGATIIVEVTDQGPGISENDLKRAFQQGAKLSAKPTAGESSSGLGLWIVRRIVDAHGGKVWVRSVIGKGSTFAFSLPMA